MRYALIGCGCSLSVALSMLTGAQAAAAETPATGTAPAAVPLPAIFFAPAEVSLSENFIHSQAAAGTVNRIMFNSMGADEDSMRLKFLATTGDHWQILRVDKPVLIDAQTASGEALLPPRVETSQMGYFIDGNLVTQGPPPPVYVSLALSIPKHPATSLRTLVATVDLTLARDDAVKTSKVKLSTEESDPPDPDGCDVTFTRVDDKVKVKYTMGAFAFVKSLVFQDAAGETTPWHVVSQSIENTRLTITGQFANKPPVTAVLEYYGDTHQVQTTLRLQNVPLIGVGSPRDLEKRPADAVHEVIKNVQAPAPTAGAGAKGGAPAPAPAGRVP